MAVLGDISKAASATKPDTALELTIPSWPDVGVAVPNDGDGGGTGGGFTGYFSFS